MAEVATQVTVPILDMNMFMSNIKTDFQGKVGPSVTQISGSTIYEENKENEGHVEVRIDKNVQVSLKSHLSYAAFRVNKKSTCVTHDSRRIIRG